MSVPLTRGLAGFVAAPPFAAVPDDVLPVVRNGFVDTVATLLAGRDETVTQAALALASQRGRADDAWALAGAARLSAADAAFVNATGAHALDYDDMALSGHPSVVLVPALLAAGEMRRASDAALMRAYLVGYEVWAELIEREPDGLHGKGWHPTGVMGTVAAAAAVAHLFGVGDEVACHALGIAGSLASGLMGNFGSMTKPLHAGWAAQHGIEAVLLARSGVTAMPNVLESPTGFLAAFSPAGRVDRGHWTLPTELRIRRNGLSIKKYPVCYASHRVIDGVLDLRRLHGLRASDVRCVSATISDVNARVLHSHEPRTALEGKFSLEFACAVALCDGGVGLREVNDQRVQSPEVSELMSRVRILTVPPGCPVEPSFALHDSVRVELNDGSVLDSGPIRFARGHVQAPLSADELRTKFFGCTRPDERAAATVLLDALCGMGNQTGASALAALDRFAGRSRTSC